MTEPAARDPEKDLTLERAPVWRDGTVRVVKRAVPATRAEGEEPPDGEARADEAEVEISISSETPVERWDWRTGKSYHEILSHKDGEIDLSYARDGLPFFVGHDSRDMVGLIEDVRLDGDGKLRGTVRFSRSARAQEIRQDIVDGIRKKISVGYDYPEDSYTESARDGIVERRRTGWRPLEASSVPIPADYDVGVGRSARPGAPRLESSPGTSPHRGKESAMTTPAAPTGVDTRAEVAAEFREISELAKLHKLEARLPEWIGGGATKDKVQADIMDHYRKQSEQLVQRGGGGDILDLSEREAKTFSFARALQQMTDGSRGFESEVSEALYKKLGRKRSNPNAILVPTQLLGRYGNAPHQRLEVATSGAGQQLKFTEYGGFFEILRNRMYIARLGAKMLSGLQGDVAFVTQPSANTFQWGAETATPTATNFGTGLKTLAPKNGAALTKYTRQLLAQSVESVEGLVQDDLMKIIAIAIDKAAISGAGSTEPTGIISTSGIGSVTMGTAGAVPTFPKLVDMETEVVVDNADSDSMAYLTTPGIRGYLKKTERFSATSGMTIWSREGGQELVNGFPAFASNQVPSNGTKGSNTGTNHTILFGDFSNVIIGEWGAIELIVDPYASKPVIIEVAAHVMVDVLLRYPEGLCAMVDARTS